MKYQPVMLRINSVYNISLRKVIADPISQSHLQLRSPFQITSHYKEYYYLYYCVFADTINSGCLAHALKYFV